ncbi:Nup93/Nic96-domain-containing protein [Gongronella butleri]|nr:Nup93/Nic96-domain-containing protein [Gongronella butleri]
MSKPTLRDIYDNTLVPMASMHGLPALKRDSSQLALEAEADMAKRVKPNPELQAKAVYNLGQAGFKHLDLGQKLSIEPMVGTPPFEVHEPLQQYLQQQHEEHIIETIEKARRQTRLDAESLINDSLEADRQHMELRLKERAAAQQQQQQQQKQSLHAYTTSVDSRVRAQRQERSMAYASVMGQLNRAQSDDKVIDVVKQFAAVTTSSTTSHDRRIDDAWLLVSKLTRSADFDTPAQMCAHRKNTMQHYAASRADASPEVITMHRNWVNAVKAWLHDQFLTFVTEKLKEQAQEAKPGGSLSIVSRLRAFITITFRKNNTWSIPNFEIVQDQPVWALLYMIIRCGRPKEARQLLLDEPALFVSEPEFVAQLTDYLTSDDLCISEAARSQVVTNYRRLKGTSADPYKLLLMKVVGRCDLADTHVPRIVSTTEDYLWLQLSLVQEHAINDYHHEQYTLKKFQDTILQYGTKSFDPQGTTPWVYFKVLMASCQFEQAVNYLYKNEQTQLEAVHFAIVLMLFGLLRIPKVALRASTDLLVFEGGVPTLNVTRMIYTHLKQSSLPLVDQFQYLFALAWYSVRNGYTTNEMLDEARALCREWVLQSPDYQWFLGSFENGYQPGFLDLHKRLVEFDDQDSYTTHFLLPLVRDYAERNLYVQAAYVAELAGDYNLVMDVLFYQLSLMFRHPSHTPDSQQDALVNELLAFCTTSLERFARFQHISQRVDDRKMHTVRAMLGFVRARYLYDHEQYEQGLDAIYATGVMPAVENPDIEALKPAVAQFDHLDDNVANLVPDLVLMTMDMLLKMYQKYNHSAQLMIKFKNRVNCLLVFTGLIRLHVPLETMTKMNRLEQMMK